VTQPLVVGTRGSALALEQARLVCDAMRERHPALTLHATTIATRGDVEARAPLAMLGRGAFVTEIESALRDGRVDIAVHSSKDLPSVLADDLTIAAYLPRADARDVLVSRGLRLRELPPGARVGTSSPRRMCQMRALRSDLDIVELRGNVDTRLRAVSEGRLDAVILAAAGVLRLGLGRAITEWLDEAEVIPCVGQGALAVEIRADDADTLAIVAQLDDWRTRAAVHAERAFLAELGAGCLAAAAAHARVTGDCLTLRAMVGAVDGRQRVGTRTGPVADAAALGADLARELLGSGAAAFLANAASALRGMRVVVTRAGDQSALLALLRARGALAESCPTITIERANPVPLDEVLADLPRFDWLAFTSMNAVNAVADRLDACGVAVPASVRLGAVGPGTAAVIASRLRRSADFVPATPSADALGAAMPDVAGRSILFPCGDLAHEALARQLSRRGAAVHSVVAYRTVEGPGVQSMRNALRDRALDIVLFASPSSLRPVVDALAAARAVCGDRRPTVACIGPTTAAYARSVGLEPDVVARSPTTGGIVEALERHLT
jgi:hydroxymethylbilane synthase